MKISTLFCSMILIWPVSFCQGDFGPVGPFTGDRSENFSSFQGGTGGFLELDIFGDAVTLFGLDGAAIKIEFQSTLIFQGRSDTVVPRSQPVFMGQLGIMEWQFNQPVSKFGGYFENNSFADDVTFEFFDVNDDLIAEVVGTTMWSSDVWTWNGWESDVPIYRAVSTGNNDVLLNGFIWYDDMEIQFATIPEPTHFTVLGLALVLGTNFRRRPKQFCLDVLRP